MSVKIHYIIFFHVQYLSLYGIIFNITLQISDRVSRFRRIISTALCFVLIQRNFWGNIISYVEENNMYSGNLMHRTEPTTYMTHVYDLTVQYYQKSIFLQNSLFKQTVTPFYFPIT